MEYGSGALGRAFSFPGAAAAVACGTGPSLDLGGDDWSVSLWIRTTQDSGYPSLLDTRSAVSGFQVQLSAGRPTVKMFLDGEPTEFVSPGDGVADGALHHVVVTVDRDRATGGAIWVDGGLVHVFDPTGGQGSLDSSEPLVLGRRSDVFGGQGFLAGVLDDMRLAARVLAADEVIALHERGVEGLLLDGFESGTFAAWSPVVGSTSGTFPALRER